MKVLLLTTHLDMGGIPVYLVNLALGLKEHGHHPVILSSGGSLERRLVQEGIPHHRIDCRTSSELNPKLWLRAWPQLLWLIRREKPDLLHAHTRVTQILSWAAGLATRVSYLSTCHGLYRYRVGRRLMPCWGEPVIAISQASLDCLVHQYRLAPPHQVALVWNGIDVGHFLQPPSEHQIRTFRENNGLWGEPVVGAVARLSPVKGLDFLLKAVPGLLKQFPNLQVLLVGDGPARADLVRLAYKLGIADRVVISYPVEDIRVPLATLSAFLIPSLEEGFGLTAAEAMAAGVPVVASAIGGLSQIVEHGRTGLLTRPGDTQSIQEAVEQLLSDPQRRCEFAEAGRRAAQERFDLNRMVAQVEDVYGRALNRHGKKT